MYNFYLEIITPDPLNIYNGPLKVNCTIPEVKFHWSIKGWTVSFLYQQCERESTTLLIWFWFAFKRREAKKIKKDIIEQVLFA